MNIELDDPLDELFSGEKRSEPRPMVRTHLAEAVEGFMESCPSCRGRGRFISYAGRDCGPCFKCKGKGKLTFKTSAADRATSRAKATERKANKAEQACEEFKAEHAAEYAWMLANVERFDFATSMWNALRTYGHLTAGQLAAVQRCVLRDEQRKAEREQRKAAAPVVEAERIESAFAHARQSAAGDGEGIKWLRLYLDTFKFSDAPARGDYAAAIFVKEGDVKIGRISGGKFHRSFHCDDATEARVLAAIADPAAAAKAYGQRTGSCSVCGRELTNKKSRELGIGPICAERYGW